MPEQKGRRRRPDDRRRAPSDTVAADAPATPLSEPAAANRQRPGRPPQRPGDIPSNTARATGLMIAVITAFLAILMINDGATGGDDGVVRIVAGLLLVAIAVVVGVLSVFPAQIRRRIRGE